MRRPAPDTGELRPGFRRPRSPRAHRNTLVHQSIHDPPLLHIAPQLTQASSRAGVVGLHLTGPPRRRIRRQDPAGIRPSAGHDHGDTPYAVGERRQKRRCARPDGGEPGRSLPFWFRTRDNRATERNDCGWPGSAACASDCGVPRPWEGSELNRGRCVERGERGCAMAAMKPRTGDGPLEVTKEGRGIVMRVPLEGGGRLVVELTADEASKLGDALKSVVG